MLRFDREEELRRVTQWDTVTINKLISMKWVDKWDFVTGARFEPDVLTGLAAMKGLLYLSFENSELEGENLRALAQLRKLRHLGLNGCRFAGDDFIFLCEQWAQGACPNLVQLSLGGTSVGDDEVRNLGEVTQLRRLDLRNTVVSDEGIKHLISLKKLEVLVLNDTHVSEEGILSLAVLSRLNNVASAGVKSKSGNLEKSFFLAQIALQKSKRFLDTQQVEAAEKRLLTFLDTIHKWRCAVSKRAQEIRERYKNMRPSPHDMSEEEARENDQFWSDISVEKTAIVQKFCSAKLLEQGAGLALSYGHTTSARPHEEWIDADTPSRKKTIIYSERNRASVWYRYTMVLENGEWRLDAVHWRDGGWKRDFF